MTGDIFIYVAADLKRTTKKRIKKLLTRKTELGKIVKSPKTTTKKIVL